MSSPLNGFGGHVRGHGHRNEDGEDLRLELSLSNGPSCTPPTPSSLSLSSVTVSVSAPSPSKSPPAPPPFNSTTTPLPYNHHYTAPIPPPPSPPPPSHHYSMLPPHPPHSQEVASRAIPRTRRSSVQPLKPGKTECVPPPFPWATDRRATIHSLDYLLSNHMSMISGQVQCKRCEKMYQMEYDLRERFMVIATFIAENKSSMHDRAPAVWMNPNLPSCKFCGQSNCVRPCINKKKSINWLFLLLGQMLGCCKLEQLKYFCKHTKNHRTGAKDRVLYLTYLGLCKQLDPTGPFDA